MPLWQCYSTMTTLSRSASVIDRFHVHGHHMSMFCDTNNVCLHQWWIQMQLNWHMPPNWANIFYKATTVYMKQNIVITVTI